MKQVFVYTNTVRAFRTTTLGYLYEIAQDHRVTLLAEQLDSETLNLVSDKKLFPGITEIVEINQYLPSSESLMQRNRRLHKVISDLYSRCKPDIVIASSDVHSLFEMYLMRMAKVSGAIRITIQDTITFKIEEIARWCDLQNIYIRTPVWFPFLLRKSIIKLRKFLGHTIYYWALPLMVWERPFFGTTSYILHKGHTGMRDTNCHIVLSRHQFELYRASGVPEKKLSIILHPLTRNSRYIFERAYQKNAKENIRQLKTVTVLLPYEGFGFRKKDMEIISTEQRIALFRWLLGSIVETLVGWRVIIKPHPMYVDATLVTDRLGNLPQILEVVDSDSAVDYYLEIADAIIDFPRSASTAVFIALQQCPGKPILSIDIDQEFLGDYYAGYDGVDYIDSKKKFLTSLAAIRDGNWKAPNGTKIADKDYDYSCLAELIANLPPVASKVL